MFVGREQELSILNKLLLKNKSDLVVVYGRRRIGKTETIRHFIETNNLSSIEITGDKEANTSTQIKRALHVISEYQEEAGVNESMENVKDWEDVFFTLSNVIKATSPNEQKVIFIDELPWLDLRNSGFLSAFSYFWNTFCEKRKDLKVIICGSAATYMINNILRNKKSLNNRVSTRIHLEPFSLEESVEFLKSKNPKYNNSTFVEFFSIFGGVAYYLDKIDTKEHPNTNIENLCFSRNALLKTEYSDLYDSLFEKAVIHREIMDVLVKKWSGFTQAELLKELKKTSPSSLTKPLRELEESEFITSFIKFGNKKKDMVYRATDCFSFFYNKWIAPNRGKRWKQLATTQSYKIWRGFAFENICILNIEKIKSLMGISGINTNCFYWAHKPNEEFPQGAQIDILLEHDNNSKNIDIIECKFYDGLFPMSKKDYLNLRTKINVFHEVTGHKYNVRVVLITSEGVNKNEYYNELIDEHFSISDFIKDS